MKRFGTISTVFAAVLLLSVLVACSSGAPRFISEGKSYTSQTVASVIEGAETSPYDGEPTADANKLRSQALAALRKQGGNAAEAADVLTRTFASSSAGVPYYVEEAAFEGKQALVVVELIGPKGGALKDRRIWVIDRQGEVLFSGTR